MGLFIMQPLLVTILPASECGIFEGVCSTVSDTVGSSVLNSSHMSIDLQLSFSLDGHMCHLYACSDVIVAMNDLGLSLLLVTITGAQELSFNCTPT